MSHRSKNRRRLALVLGAAGAGALLVPSLASAVPASAGGAGLFGHVHVSASGENARVASPQTLPANVQVVATGLNQPRKITIGPDGNLLVTEAGTNDVPTGCVTGAEPACANPSGAIARVTPERPGLDRGEGLPSINNGPTSGPGASGPSGITMVNGKIQFLIQNSGIDATTGDQTYGPAGALLGNLLSVPLSGGAPTAEANLGRTRRQTIPTTGQAAVPATRPSTPIRTGSPPTRAASPSPTPQPTTCSSTRTEH